MIDDLTGLVSRTGFFIDLDARMQATAGNQHKIACLLIEVHELKKINATHGYTAGDQVLMAFAQRIKRILREQDSAARIGDNRFALIIDPILNDGHASLAANKVINLLKQAFGSTDEQIYLKASIGIALYPMHADDNQSLLQKAEAALEQARNSHSDFHIYCQDSDRFTQQSQVLTQALKLAIENDELVMHYQPQISIQQQNLISVEALVRWQHPQRGMIPPDRFIGLAENYGLIIPLTLWTLNTSLRNCKPWFDRWPDFRVSVNLSAAMLHEPDLAEMIHQSMQIWGVQAHNLMLEVTESSMMNHPERSLKNLCKLHKAGVNISIDDFGTGYSSLSYLKQLPVHEIKIDRSFVMNMSDNNDDRKIVRSVIDLGHNFDLEVVAEGIENEQTLSELRGMGCDIGQGYHISRPIPIEEVNALIENGAWKIAT